MAYPIVRYGLKFSAGTNELEVERHMLRSGGQWIGKSGRNVGNGMLFHMRKFEELLWPGEKLFHRWNLEQLELYLHNRSLGVMGPASSGKTNSAATDLLADWLVFPECTTVLISSTTLERLEDRIWGEIKKYFKLAKRRWPHIAGHLIEGKRRILFDGRSEASEGRDFRNGIIGVPTKRGENYVGLGDYIGIKNTRVRMAADELQLLPAIFIFAASNLDKNPDFKMVGLGNPKDTTDALGALCEPAFDLGGWDGNIDQAPETKTWKTRYGGVALQLVGTDSPNLDGKLGIPLITQEAIDRDIERYGRDSLQFTMMNQGMMPKGQGSRRIITRQICLRNHAMEEPVWLDSDRTKIAFMDAAYGGAGGDRCVYGELEFGREIAPLNLQEITPDLTTQAVNRNRHRQVIALTRTTLVPINVKLDVPAEEQIVTWVKSQCDTANIPPEHFIFDAGMRTVLVSKFGQLWSPAVVSVDFGGMPSDRPVGTGLVDKKGKIVTCREYYSKFVTELWYTVRLVIESGQFRGLTDGVMQEGCMREWTITGGNKIEVEPKDKMKDKCFVAGTLIKTPHGEVPIEWLKVGDLVDTPFGPSPVAVAHEYESSSLTEVAFSNRRVLVGTSDHKVFTWDKGWVSMDTMSLHSKVECVNRLWLWKIANLSYTKTTSTTFKHLVDIISEAGTRPIRGRREFYTALFGRTIVARFQRAWKSTTRMGTGRTIASTIWSWVVGEATLPTTCVSGGQTPHSGPEHSSAYQTLLQSHWCGTGLKRGGSGIGSMGWQHGGTGSRLSRCVKYVLIPFYRFIHSQNTAPRSAATMPALEPTMTFLRSVLSAAIRLWETDIQSRNIAPRVVRPLPCGKPVKVYNLTLLEHNAYYASGVLVANCGRSPDLFDALCAGVELARRLGFAIELKEPLERRAKAASPAWKRQALEKSKKAWAEGALEG